MGAEVPVAGRPARPTRCPICRRPAAPAFRPFCSAPCRDRDLANWLDGRYAIPVTESEPDDDGSAQGG